MESRHCEFAGCRKWAMRGSRFCDTHPDGQPRMVYAGPPPENRRCAFEGCRKWTKRGSSFCEKHPGGQPCGVSFGPPPEDRRCAFASCHKWAAHGSPLCNMHQEGYRSAYTFGPPPEDRRCAFQGCHKWTVRGSSFCYTHPDGQPRILLAGPPPPDRCCAFEGCHKWTVRGSHFCNTHLDGGRSEVAGWSHVGNQHARKHGLYATYVQTDGLEEALNMPIGNLRVEIAGVRHALARLLASDLPPLDLLDGVVTASRALVRLLTTNRLLFEDGPDQDEAAIEQMLRELGLDGDTEAEGSPRE